jgi:hypothetical protein
MKDAAKLAHVFLGRMPAWAPYPFAPDPSHPFYEPIFRTGEMTKAELAEKRSEWIEREHRRVAEGRTAQDPWILWANVYGSFAETREEALEAISNMVRDTKLPVAGRRALFVDFALGKVYALAGRWDEATPHLARIASSCTTFDDVTIVMRAHLFLGEAAEAKGNAPGAREHYLKIADTWPKATPSKTYRRAAERLAALPPR